VSSAGADRGGELAQDRHGHVPAHAGVGDALADGEAAADVHRGDRPGGQAARSGRTGSYVTPASAALCGTPTTSGKERSLTASAKP
jgi:hypothetical protein